MDRSINEICGSAALRILAMALDPKPTETNQSSKKTKEGAAEKEQDTAQVREADQALSHNDNSTRANSNQPEVSRDQCATSGDDDKNDDDEWEDLQIIDSDCGSPDSELDDKFDIEVPETFYLFIEPNKYMFTGVELTKTHI